LLPCTDQHWPCCHIAAMHWPCCHIAAMHWPALTMLSYWIRKGGE
jgi:hypothetical protein